MALSVIVALTQELLLYTHVLAVLRKSGKGVPRFGLAYKMEPGMEQPPSVNVVRYYDLPPVDNVYACTMQL